MNKKTFLLLAFAALFFTSCSSTYYYQVFKVIPAAPISNDGGILVFEDENCRVSYNLWQQGGNMGFLFTNKTNENIYLDLTECFYILNGIAFDYYKERSYGSASSQSSTSAASKRAILGVQKSQSSTDYIYSNTTPVWSAISASSTIGSVVSESSSITVNERRVICIPSNASKVFNEYKITEAIYRDCDLLRYPGKNQNKSKFFTKEDSPVNFSNRLAYYVGDLKNIIRIENAFHVSEISNHPEKEIIGVTPNEYCGDINNTNRSISYFKNFAPDKFYISYPKSLNRFKH